MDIRQAGSDEFEQVRNFYWNLIEDMEGRQYRPLWQKGVYPADADLKDAIGHGELWIRASQNRIHAAAILNHSCNPEYGQASWTIEAKKEETAILHAFGVAGSEQGKGTALEFLSQLIDKAREQNNKVIHLDVLAGNLPAERLYPKAGFQFVQDMQMFYEDTGWTDFKLYELDLNR